MQQAATAIRRQRAAATDSRYPVAALRVTESVVSVRGVSVGRRSRCSKQSSPVLSAR